MAEFKDVVGVVYLSGPMDNLSDEEGIDEQYSMTKWRKKAERYFWDHNEINVINPVRTPKAINDAWIIQGDLLSIDKSDALLVNLSQMGEAGVTGKTILGSGTTMEIFYMAHVRNRPVVAFYGDRDPSNISVWIKRHCSIICKTQLEAMQWLVSLNNKKIRDNDTYVKDVFIS